MEERDGKYGILFLDEISTADEAQIQPALGLCDDSRNIGTYTLPEHWMVVAAGNGPECSNFIRLDDMTISRFSVYDITYQYYTDWSPWGHAHKVNPDIIAFLDFSPDSCVRTESNDLHIAGKQFPCPRTWYRLHCELQIRAASGNPVSQKELAAFAGRIVGAAAGTEFAFFCSMQKKMKYKPDRIIDGTENEPEQISAQIGYFLIEHSIRLMEERTSERMKSAGVDRVEEWEPDSVGYFESTVEICHFLQWYLAFQNIQLDIAVEAVSQLRMGGKAGLNIGRIFAAAPERIVKEHCPEFSEFMRTYGKYLMQHLNKIGSRS